MCSHYHPQCQEIWIHFKLEDAFTDVDCLCPYQPQPSLPALPSSETATIPASLADQVEHGHGLAGSDGTVQPNMVAETGSISSIPTPARGSDGRDGAHAHAQPLTYESIQAGFAADMRASGWDVGQVSTCPQLPKRDDHAEHMEDDCESCVSTLTSAMAEMIAQTHPDLAAELSKSSSLADASSLLSMSASGQTMGIEAAPLVELSLCGSVLIRIVFGSAMNYKQTGPACIDGFGVLSRSFCLCSGLNNVEVVKRASFTQ